MKRSPRRHNWREPEQSNEDLAQPEKKKKISNELQSNVLSLAQTKRGELPRPEAGLGSAGEAVTATGDQRSALAANRMTRWASPNCSVEAEASSCMGHGLGRGNRDDANRVLSLSWVSNPVVHCQSAGT